MALDYSGYGRSQAYALNFNQSYRQSRIPELETARLCLRRWQPEDVRPFYEMRLDAVGMEFFPSVVSPIFSMASIEYFEKNFDERGYGFWAVESLSTGDFVGCVGLYPRQWPNAVPRVAIGWQIARQHWGHGYAKEAAQAVLKDGFKRVRINEIIAVIAKDNYRSCRVAESLGMLLQPALVLGMGMDTDFDSACRQRVYRIRSARRR